MTSYILVYIKSKYQGIIKSLKKLILTFFCKEPDSKLFRLWGLRSFCHNCSTLLLLHERSHRQYIDEWAWLSSITTLFLKTGRGYRFGLLAVVCRSLSSCQIKSVLQVSAQVFLCKALLDPPSLKWLLIHFMHTTLCLFYGHAHILPFTESVPHVSVDVVGLPHRSNHIPLHRVDVQSEHINRKNNWIGRIIETRMTEEWV